MSETSEERTKRTYINHLLSSHWDSQISVFFDYVENDGVSTISDNGCDVSRDAMDCYKYVSEYQRKKLKHRPFLWRLQVKYHPKTKWLCLFWSVLTYGVTEQELKELKQVIKQRTNMRQTRTRELYNGKIDSMARSIKQGKPHNLQRFYGERKVNRFHKINGSSCVPVN